MVRFVAVLCFAILAALPLRAQQDQIRAVIDNQIAAFQIDDFETAFGFASPEIRQIFRTPETFGQMVRDGYPMVYRPRSYAFTELRNLSGLYQQYLQIEGPDGFVYIAEYSMVETELGWKISGVRIFRTPQVGT